MAINIPSIVCDTSLHVSYTSNKGLLMKRSNKHQVQKIVLNNLIGGINTSDAPERIPDTDMQVCENFIYDNLRLRSRGGLSAASFSMEENIVSLYYDVDTNAALIFLENKNVYVWHGGNLPVLIGSLTGDKKPCCAKYMNKIWIASGGKLQYYDYTTLYTVYSSPNCDIAFQRLSRLLISLAGSDRVYFSAIGDPTSWDNITDNAQGAVESSAQWIDIGYGDSGDIQSIVPLANDLIFLKSNGNIYQMQSDRTPASWVVPPAIVTNSDSMGIMTATNIGADVVFLSRRGLKSLSTVMDYGNVKAQDIGDKFRSLITKDMWEPQMINLKRHGFLMLRTTSDRTLWTCYNYLMGVATTIKFAVPVTDIMETVDEVYVASKTKIYLWDKDNMDDNGVPIQYVMKPHDILSSDEMLVKAVDTKFTNDEAGKVEVSTGKLKVEMPTNSRRKVLCNNSTDCISLTVKGTEPFTFDHIVLDVADL